MMSRRHFLSTLAALAATPSTAPAAVPIERLEMTDAQWRQRLAPPQYVPSPPPL